MSVATITTEHFHIHNDEGFTVTYYVAELASTGTFDFVIVNPASSYPHLRKFVVSFDEGPFLGQLYEGTTFTTEPDDYGTALDMRNNNRSSSKTPTITGVYHTPTILDIGTEIDVAIMPSANTGGAKGTEIGEEWILKPSTNYTMRYTNNGNQTAAFSTHIFWYEEEW